MGTSAMRRGARAEAPISAQETGLGERRHFNTPHVGRRRQVCSAEPSVADLDATICVCLSGMVDDEVAAAPIYAERADR